MKLRPAPLAGLVALALTAGITFAAAYHPPTTDGTLATFRATDQPAAVAPVAPVDLGPTAVPAQQATLTATTGDIVKAEPKHPAPPRPVKRRAHTGQDWACDLMPGGIVVCEGNVPRSVGRHMTVAEYFAYLDRHAPPASRTDVHVHQEINQVQDNSVHVTDNSVTVVDAHTDVHADVHVNDPAPVAPAPETSPVAQPPADTPPAYQVHNEHDAKTGKTDAITDDAPENTPEHDKADENDDE